MYAITSRDFKSWHLPPTYPGDDICKEYNKDRFKKWVLSPESAVYGLVLTRYKKVKSGISIKVKLKWRDWRWKPRISWRYGKHFHWLFLMSWIEYEYDNVPDKIVKDHLDEKLKIGLMEE